MAGIEGWLGQVKATVEHRAGQIKAKSMDTIADRSLGSDLTTYTYYLPTYLLLLVVSRSS
jgi:hypothetical protein